MVLGLLAVLAGLGFLVRCFFAFSVELAGSNGAAFFPFLRKTIDKHSEAVDRVIEFPGPRDSSATSQAPGNQRRTGMGTNQKAGVIVVATVVAHSQAQEARSNDNRDCEIGSLLVTGVAGKLDNKQNSATLARLPRWR